MSNELISEIIFASLYTLREPCAARLCGNQLAVERKNSWRTNNANLDVEKLSGTERVWFCKLTAKTILMTRFDLLAILETQSSPISCARIAVLSGSRRCHRRSFQADLATRLRRLYRWGLLRRRDVSKRNFLGGWGKRPKYLWSISARGRERLAWARRRNLVELFKQAFANAGTESSSRSR